MMTAVNDQHTELHAKEHAIEPEDDAMLVSLASMGQPRAQAAIWDRYAPLVRAIVRRSIAQESDVDDLVQEVFLRFYRNIRHLRSPEALRSFIFAISFRVTISELRSRRSRRWLRLGDSNSVMAQGGMQISVAPEDSPVTHFVDTLKGGHMQNDHQLLKVMVEEGPSIAKWLLSLGVLFDRDGDGNLHVKKGGGSSKPRLLTCSDYTGLEIMRVLKDEVLNQNIQLLEFCAAIELTSDEKGNCTGAILKDLDNQRLIVVAAKSVILATGGIGRLHIQGFPTSNHYGATGDGLCLAYRLGAKLMHIDTFQYHPSGAVYPEQLIGALVTEGIRSEGGHLVNAQGERFVNEMDTRDVVSSSIIRECEEGRGIRTMSGRIGVWLDTPLLDVEHGTGTLEKHFPAMMMQFDRFGIDISKDPVLIYPTLHYQNGGVKIDTNSETNVHNLFVAGEASGGLHGRNRLMGNSLLDLMVFGKRSGLTAGSRAAAMPQGKLTVGHVKGFRAEAKKHGNVSGIVSPMILPAYTRKE